MLKDIYDLYNISNKFKKDVMEQDVIGIVWSSDHGLSVHFAANSGAVSDIADFLDKDVEVRCQGDYDKYYVKINDDLEILASKMSALSDYDKIYLNDTN